MDPEFSSLSTLSLSKTPPPPPPTVAPNLNPPQIREPEPKECTGGADYSKTNLDQKFLKGKIQISFPEGEEGDPSVLIHQEVVDALSSVWRLSLVVTLLGHSLNFASMERKLHELWRFSLNMKVINLTWECFLVRFGSEEDFTTTMTGCSWMIFERCLVVHSWSPSFQPSQPIQMTPTWAPDHQKTLFSNRGCFDRIYVEVNLEKPLKSTIMMNGDKFLIEYEGLLAICHCCLWFGRQKSECLYHTTLASSKEEADVIQPNASLAGGVSAVGKEVVGGVAKAGNHGEWMDESWRRRTNSWRARKEATSANKSIGLFAFEPLGNTPKNKDKKNDRHPGTTLTTGNNRFAACKKKWMRGWYLFRWKQMEVPRKKSPKLSQNDKFYSQNQESSQQKSQLSKKVEHTTGDPTQDTPASNTQEETNGNELEIEPLGTKEALRPNSRKNKYKMKANKKVSQKLGPNKDLAKETSGPNNEQDLLNSTFNFKKLMPTNPKAP
ncbi:LOW QUALITY PROTEIN: hypothetical protein V2J09_009807 [Rumex salicifolius]